MTYLRSNVYVLNPFPTRPSPLFLPKYLLTFTIVTHNLCYQYLQFLRVVVCLLWRLHGLGLHVTSLCACQTRRRGPLFLLSLIFVNCYPSNPFFIIFMSTTSSQSVSPHDLSNSLCKKYFDSTSLVEDVISPIASFQILPRSFNPADTFLQLFSFNFHFFLQF